MQRAPYGSWQSPVSIDLVSRAIAFEQPEATADGVYWLESRPSEGRTALVLKPWDGDAADALPREFNVRTSVHEYGGGAYWLHGATLFFANFEDQRLYRSDRAGAEPRALTPEPSAPKALRYADGDVTPDGTTIVCVRERHGDDEPVNELVALPTDGSSEPTVVASGHDFFSFPRFSPDGSRLAWTSWDHPNMPFVGTDLWVADWTSDGVGEPRHIAGGPSESIFQPSWSPEGVLHFVSDRSGWWNLYTERDGSVEAVAPVDGELGWMQWLFAWSSYAFLPDGRIACLLNRKGRQPLTLLDPATGEYTEVGVRFDSVRSPTLRAHGSRLIRIAGNAREPTGIVVYDVERDTTKVLAQATEERVDPAFVSVPEAIEYPTLDGVLGYGLYYAPKNPQFEGPEGERPPLVVGVHGGPTAQSVGMFSVTIQYLTSRGLAVLDVNYGGSTGYGRAYSERLRERWGIVDTADSIAAAQYLVDRGDVDPDRIAITGGSAGGYTTLYALTFEDFFATGASFFGVTDLLEFNKTTHKFESRYDSWLLGPLPEAEETYRERSPATYADRLRTPVLLLQGLEDHVVPPSQAEIMVEMLRRNGVPFAYIAFEGEGHGFRRAENIRRSYEAVLSFFGRVLGFEPADAIEAVEIENL